MTVSSFLNVKRTSEIVKELEQLGETEKGFADVEKVIVISEGSFNNHNRKFKGKQPHLWYAVDNGIYTHYTHYPDGSPKSANIVSHGHGFRIWVEKDRITFIAPAHWSVEHGKETLKDLKEWIRLNLKEKVEVLEESVG